MPTAQLLSHAHILELCNCRSPLLYQLSLVSQITLKHNSFNQQILIISQLLRVKKLGAAQLDGSYQGYLTRLQLSSRLGCSLWRLRWGRGSNSKLIYMISSFSRGHLYRPVHDMASPRVSDPGQIKHIPTEELTIFFFLYRRISEILFCRFSFTLQK